MFTTRTYFIQKSCQKPKNTCQNAVLIPKNNDGFMQKTETYEK